MMKKNDYISTVLKGVNNESKKKNIEAELDSHISDSKDFYEEIGYDDEEAEEIAVERMGDAEPVAEQFAMIHNKSKFGTVIVTALTFIILYIIDLFSCYNYYIDNVFNNFEAGKLCVKLGIIILLSFYALHKKSNSLGLLPIGVLCIDLSYFQEGLSETTILLAVVTSIFIVSNSLFIFRYNYKISQCKNSKKDLKIKHALQIINKIVVVIFIGLAIYFIATAVTILDETAKNYEQAMYAGIEIEENIFSEGIIKATEKHEKYPSSSTTADTEALYNPTITQFENIYFTIDYSPKDENWSEAFTMNLSPHIDGINYMNIIVYSPFREDTNMIDKAFKNDFFEGKNKQEILSYLIESKPIGLIIYTDGSEENEMEAVRYTFHYKYYDYYNINDYISVKFDKDGNLVDIEY